MDQTTPVPVPEADPTPSAAKPLDLDAIAAELAEVEAALGRLDEGRYGRCVVCDNALDDAVLAERPTAQTCEAHLPV